MDTKEEEEIMTTIITKKPNTLKGSAGVNANLLTWREGVGSVVISMTAHSGFDPVRHGPPYKS